jgi:hypothetical protein
VKPRFSSSSLKRPQNYRSNSFEDDSLLVRFGSRPPIRIPWKTAAEKMLGKAPLRIILRGHARTHESRLNRIVLPECPPKAEYLATGAEIPEPRNDLVF